MRPPSWRKLTGRESSMFEIVMSGDTLRSVSLARAVPPIVLGPGRTAGLTAVEPD